MPGWPSRPQPGPAAGDETIIGREPTSFGSATFPQLPDPFTWQTTHNVAVDSGGHLYVIHEGRKELKDHPAIFVFDPTGRLFGPSAASFRGAAMASRFAKKAARSFSTSVAISG